MMLKMNGCHVLSSKWYFVLDITKYFGVGRHGHSRNANCNYMNYFDSYRSRFNNDIPEITSISFDSETSKLKMIISNWHLYFDDSQLTISSFELECETSNKSKKLVCFVVRMVGFLFCLLNWSVDSCVDFYFVLFLNKFIRKSIYVLWFLFSYS